MEPMCRSRKCRAQCSSVITVHTSLINVRSSLITVHTSLITSRCAGSAPPFVQYQLQNGAYVQQPQAQGAMLMQTGALRGGGFAGAAVTTGAGGGVASLQRFQGQTQGVQMVGLGGNQAAAGAGVAVAPGGGAGASLAGAGIPLVRTVPDDPAAVVDREHSAIRKPGEQTAEATVGGAAVGGGATATAAAVANAGATDAQEAGEGEPGGGEAKAEEAIQTAVAGAAAATAAGEEEGAPQDALKCGSIFDPAALSKAAKDFKKVLWKPQPGKFLLAYCTRGEVRHPPHTPGTPLVRKRKHTGIKNRERTDGVPH